MMIGLKLRSIQEGITHLCRKYFAVEVLDVKIFDDPWYDRTNIHILAYRNGTVHNGLCGFTYKIDNIRLADKSITIYGAFSDIPEMLRRKYITARVIKAVW